MARKADPERSAARREAITRAAAKLFAERGFEKTSAAEIAKAAGLSSGSVFYYFADKRALFRSVFERDLPMSRELVQRCTAGEDPVGSILAMVDELAVEPMDPIASGILVEVLRQAGKDPDLMRVIAENTAILHEGFAVLVERGIRTGAIDPALDPRETAEWIQVVIDGAFLRRRPRPGPAPDAAPDHHEVPRPTVRPRWRSSVTTTDYVPRDSIAAVFLDGKELVLLDAETKQITRNRASDLSKTELQAAFERYGYPWTGIADPHEPEFQRWTDGHPNLDEKANKLLRTRARALQDEQPGAAADLADRLQSIEVVLRDRDGNQQYRRIPPTG